MNELNLVSNSYRINERDFILKTDFTFEELEWLDVVYNRIAPSVSPKGGANEIKGSFTREEIKKTLKILLTPFPSGRDGDGLFSDEDFQKTRESLSVKIIADFFLTKAVLGTIIKSFSMN